MKQAFIYSFKVWLTAAIGIPTLALNLGMAKKKYVLTTHQFSNAQLNGLLVAVSFYFVFLICVLMVTYKYKSPAVCKRVLTGIALTLVAASFAFVYLKYSAYLTPWEFCIYQSLYLLLVPFAIYRYRLQPLAWQREAY